MAHQLDLPDACDDGFTYIQDFVTEDEEAFLLAKIDAAPRWKALAHRRLQMWGGECVGKTLVSKPLPPHVTQFPALITRLEQTGAFVASKHGQPNHCLVNEYLPGQGIMPHADGPAYFPVVATISLGAPTLLDWYRTKPEGGYDPTPAFSILLEPRSLLITRGQAYTRYLHGIDARMHDSPEHVARVINAHALAHPTRAAYSSVVARRRRVSLTFRDVERVQKGLG